jgi:hypothetical protein
MLASRNQVNGNHHQQRYGFASSLSLPVTLRPQEPKLEKERSVPERMARMRAK